MKFAAFALAFASIFAGNAPGQTPTVGGLLNNYSFILPGLPSYGIARGSIFDIFGTNLSSSTTLLQGPRLQTTLNGVTINVMVNGTTTNPLFYFESPTQIAAILPSATPVGTGTITVTTGAGTSAAFPIQVVESAFGLLTTNNGSGPVAGFDASNNGVFLGFSAAANPGDILELWGTGLGPVQADAAGVAVTDPIEVDIGGISAAVLYHGRSSYAGLDQINVKVPSGVSGCYVSMAVVTGSYVSNFGTLPVAVSGRTCSDSFNPIISASNLDKISQTGAVSIGVISLSEVTAPGTTVAGVTVNGATGDLGFATFARGTSAQFNAGAYAGGGAGSPSVGSCLVNFYSASTGSSIPPPAFTFTNLNAGPEININGPDGALAMPIDSVGSSSFYVTPIGATSFIPASGGSFTFDNGSGGPDVGTFTAQLQMPSPVTWSNLDTISMVTRSNGLTVNWSGGDLNTYVSIAGLSFGSVNGSTSDFVVGGFTCQAPTSAGTFTVPPLVLLSLPHSSLGLSTSSLLVSNVSAPVSFAAQGLDVGFLEAIVEKAILVTYQ